MSVKLGMFAMPLHRPERDYQEILREDQEAIILADHLGLSEFFVGEHHTTLLERVTSPLMFLASIANQTKSIRLGTGVMNLPLMHPVAVASHAAQFDNLCGGRFIMGIGPGSLYTDSEAFGLTQADVRGRMMLESIAHVHRLWTEDPPFEIPGEFWNIKLKDTLWPDFKVGWPPRPVQRPHPPVAVPARAQGNLCGRLRGRRPPGRSRRLARRALLPGDRLRRRSRGLPGRPGIGAVLLLQVLPPQPVERPGCTVHVEAG